MRKRVVFFLLLLLLSGGCGGGGGSGVVAGDAVRIVSAQIPVPEADAYGTLEAEVVLSSYFEGEIAGFRVYLYGTPEGGGREEFLASTAVTFLSNGSGAYRLRLAVEAFDADLGYLKTGAYADLNFRLVALDTCTRAVDETPFSPGLQLKYTAAGECSVIVAGSLTVEIDAPPAAEGFAGAAVAARQYNGWSCMDAGVVDGKILTVAYAATVDMRMELACASWDIAGFEIAESGGALLIGKKGDEPKDTIYWEGPFRSGEVGRSFAVMYWGDASPPDVGTLEFIVTPIPAEGTASRGSRFAPRTVHDEVTRVHRSRAAAETAVSPSSGTTYYAPNTPGSIALPVAGGIPDGTPVVSVIERPEETLFEANAPTYQQLCKTLWSLWKEYELKQGTWDDAVTPNFWFAKLYDKFTRNALIGSIEKELGNFTNDEMTKYEFFSRSWPINLDDPNYPREYQLRIPKAYDDARKKFDALYNAVNVKEPKVPYGRMDYFKWWTSLPSWMIAEIIFPLPARDYGTITIGDMMRDDYLWLDALPRFYEYVRAYGTNSREYAAFWHEILGVPQEDDRAAPSRSPEEYRTLFPTPSVGISTGDDYGPYAGKIPDVASAQLLSFDYGTRNGAQFIEYRNRLAYGGDVAGGSTKLNAGYSFTYDDGTFLEVYRDSGSNAASVKTETWLNLDFAVPVWVFQRSIEACSATANYSVSLSQAVNYDYAGGTPSFGGYAQKAGVDTALKLFGVSVFEKGIVFGLETGPKATVKEHRDVKYPLFSKAFEVSIVDPDVAKVTYMGVEIAFGFGVGGEAGLDFVYNYGVLNKEADGVYRVYASPIGARIALTPGAKLGANASVSVSTPSGSNFPQIAGMGVKGEVALIEANLPLYMTRELGVVAEKVTLDGENKALSPGGAWVYSLASTREYGLDLELEGLSGKLDLILTLIGKKFEIELFKWEGMTYADIPLLNSSSTMPLSIAAD